MKEAKEGDRFSLAPLNSRVFPTHWLSWDLGMETFLSWLLGLGVIRGRGPGVAPQARAQHDRLRTAPGDMWRFLAKKYKAENQYPT